jgi:sulfatase modifying factor 1
MRLVVTLRWAALLLASGVATRCALDETGVTYGDAATSDAQNEVTVLPTEGGAEAGDAASGDAVACPTNLPGPPLVQVGDYCIDSTEVTVGHYAAFVAAQDGGVPDGGSYCSWVNELTPSDTQVVMTEPQVFVHWCLAHEYCEWAGKHLCGAHDGGPMGPWPALDTTSRWYAACSAAGTRTYCYGSTWDAGTCNDDNLVGQVEPVKSFPGCVGGFFGLFDMTGNAREWIDSCSKYVDDNDNCMVIGGDFSNDHIGATCNAVRTDRHRNDSDDSTGFRCCFP